MTTPLRQASELDRMLTYLELTITRRLDGLLRGSFASFATGPGSDPDAAREYQFGDDVRRMDWAVTARTGVPHVREPEAERELQVWVVADAQSRLLSGSGTTTKHHLLLNSALAIALLNNSPGSSTGLFYGSGRSLAPGSGRDHALRLAKNVAVSTTGGTLATDLTAVARRGKRTGLTVVISDFLGPLDWVEPLRLVQSMSQVLVLRLVDPSDLALPGDGPVTVADADTGKHLDITIDAATRRRYAAAAQQHYDAVTSALRRSQARVIELRTDTDWVLSFARGFQRQEALR